MPMERIGSPRSSASRRTEPEGRPRLGLPPRGHHHQPAHGEPQAAERSDEGRNGGRLASGPPGVPREGHLDEHLDAGPGPGDPLPLDRAATPTASSRRAGRGRRSCWSGGAEEVPRGARLPRRARRAWPRAPARSSRPTSPSPAATAASTASGPKPLVTASTRDHLGVTARRLDPRVIAPRRAATSSPLRGSTSAGRSRPGRSALCYRRNDGTSKSSSPISISSSSLSAKMSTGAALAREPSTLERGVGRPRAAADPFPALEARRDHGHLDLVGHVLVDHRAEDDVGVGVRDRVDDLGGLVHLEQPEVVAADDVEQDARGPPRSRPRAAGW